jgi:hypothetical protein
MITDHMTVRSKAQIVLAYSKTGILESNPTRGMYMSASILCLCYPVKVAGL